MLEILIPTVAQGLMWALLALGVYITFRVLDIADLSVEGSFPLGAAVAATALVNGMGLAAAFALAAYMCLSPAAAVAACRLCTSHILQPAKIRVLELYFLCPSEK